MSAPPTQGRCAVTSTTARGWPPGGASQPQRRTGLRPLLSVAVPKPAAAVAAVRGGSGVNIRLKPLPVSPSRSTALKAGQQAGRNLLPPPQPCCTGCVRLAVAGSLLVSVLAISAPSAPASGGSPLKSVDKRASPARARPTRVSGAGKLPRRHGLSIKPGSGRKSGPKPDYDIGEKVS